MDAQPVSALPDLMVSLEPTSTAPRAARRAIDQVRGRLPTSLLLDLQLIASELVTNSVLHSGMREDQRILLRLGLRHSHRGPVVRLSVRDPGPGFEPPGRGDPTRERHWGLHLVRRLSSGWGIERTELGTEVWAQMRLPASGAHAILSA